jgi:predicted ATPase
MPSTTGFLRAIRLLRDKVPDFTRYPFSIPAVAALDELPLDPRVTIFVGENGSGKSTLIEAIALAARFGPEGGTKSIRFATQSSESELHRFLILVREARREKSGFFLRAESLFNVATRVDDLGLQQFGWANRSCGCCRTASIRTASTSWTSPKRRCRRSASCPRWRSCTTWSAPAASS